LAHLAQDERDLATSALGGYDAHPSKFVITAFGRQSVNEQAGWLDQAAVAAMRARLAPDAVAAAAAVARSRSVEQLIDELIIQPAENIS
jgi:isocitrate dehydrogenase kinase/phosphatase